MKESKLTTIVIVTFKGLVVEKTLENLNKKFKIILIENSQNEFFQKKIEDKYKNIKVYLLKKNLGFSVANNIGLKKVKTHYSLVLNPDMHITANQVLELEKISKTIKDFGILTCNCNGLFETIFSKTDKYDDFKTKNSIDSYKLNKNKKVLFEIPYVPGWCMFFKSKDLKKINYFDKNFFLYFEDRDISKRIKNIGKKLIVINSIKVKHLFGSNSKNKNKLIFNKSWHIRFWHVYWSSFYYHRKHYGLLLATKVHFFKFFRFTYLKFYYKVIGNTNLSELNKFKASGILSQLKNIAAISGPNADL
jgi:GT2 family glycosyltransferase|tara:strand:+ start:1927 stop:2841 length:915 start_codon:yes stop_codon:yes gene_type:complete